MMKNVNVDSWKGRYGYFRSVSRWSIRSKQTYRIVGVLSTAFFFIRGRAVTLSVPGPCSYVQRTEALRKSGQFLVLWADNYKGRHISCQWLSHWVVNVIVMRYKDAKLQSLPVLQAYSARGILPGLCSSVFLFRTFVLWLAGHHRTLLWDIIDWMWQSHSWLIQCSVWELCMHFIHAIHTYSVKHLGAGPV